MGSVTWGEPALLGGGDSVSVKVPERESLRCLPSVSSELLCVLQRRTPSLPITHPSSVSPQTALQSKLHPGKKRQAYGEARAEEAVRGFRTKDGAGAVGNL